MNVSAIGASQSGYKPEKANELAYKPRQEAAGALAFGGGTEAAGSLASGSVGSKLNCYA